MEKSCGTIIIKDDKVLVIRQKSTMDFGFPKGHMENETEVETAIRETKEEVNILVKVDTSKRYTISYLVKNNIPKEVVYFVATVIDDKNMKKQDEEISDILWVPIDEVRNILTHDNLKELWDKVYSDIQNIVC